MIAQIDSARNRHSHALGHAIEALHEISQLTALPVSGELERQYLAAIEIVNKAAGAEINRLANSEDEDESHLTIYGDVNVGHDFIGRDFINQFVEDDNEPDQRTDNPD